MSPQAVLLISALMGPLILFKIWKAHRRKEEMSRMERLRLELAAGKPQSFLVIATAVLIFVVMQQFNK